MTTSTPRDPNAPVTQQQLDAVMAANRSAIANLAADTANLAEIVDSQRATLATLTETTDYLILVSGIQGTSIARAWDEIQGRGH